MAKRSCEYFDNDKFYDAYDKGPYSDRSGSNYSTPRASSTPRSAKREPSCFTSTDIPCFDTENELSFWSNSFTKKNMPVGKKSTRSTSPTTIRREIIEEIAISFSDSDLDLNCKGSCSKSYDSDNFEIVECPVLSKSPSRCSNDANIFEYDNFRQNKSYANEDGSYFQNKTYQTNKYMINQPKSYSKAPPSSASYYQRPQSQKSCQNSFCNNSLTGNRGLNDFASPRLPPCLSNLGQSEVRDKYSTPSKNIVEDDMPDCCKRKSKMSSIFEGKPIVDLTIHSRPFNPPVPPCVEPVKVCRPVKVIQAMSTEAFASDNYSLKNKKSEETKVSLKKKGSGTSQKSGKKAHAKSGKHPKSSSIKSKTSSNKVRVKKSGTKIQKKVSKENKTENKSEESTKEDSIKLLGVTISTIMLLATDSPVPENYSSWSIKYLKCIKNCKGELPANVKKFLKMLGVNEAELCPVLDTSCFCGSTK